MAAWAFLQVRAAGPTATESLAASPALSLAGFLPGTTWPPETGASFIGQVSFWSEFIPLYPQISLTSPLLSPSVSYSFIKKPEKIIFF